MKSINEDVISILFIYTLLFINHACLGITGTVYDNKKCEHEYWYKKRGENGCTFSFLADRKPLISREQKLCIITVKNVDVRMHKRSPVLYIS